MFRLTWISVSCICMSVVLVSIYFYNNNNLDLVSRFGVVPDIHRKLYGVAQNHVSNIKLYKQRRFHASLYSFPVVVPHYPVRLG